MELTPRNKNKKLRNERKLLTTGLLLLVISLVMIFWLKPYADVTNTPDRIACNAERARGNNFYNDDYKFGGAEHQTSLKARSGSYSIRFPADGNTRYGFTTIIENPKPGEVYEAYVWSLANVSQYAKLTVQGRDPSGFYMESAEVIERDDAGWNLHKIRFSVPFKDTPKSFGVYVYSGGAEEVFFDDLLIQKVDLWKESDFKPQQLKLRLSDAAMQQLSDKRYEALGKGLLMTGDDDWVSAELETNKSQKLEVKLRLKGDWLDHLRGDKWSYRIKLKGSDAWEGMQTFSLHSPVARYYLHEWLLHRWWKEQDVLTPRYDFIELIVNGESKGIYAYEEHFQKQLVESQERREGPLVKFSEDGFWSGIARQFEHQGFSRAGSGLTAMDKGNAPITAFNEKDVLADPLQAKYYQQAQILLEQYRNGHIPAADIFDLNKLATYYAGCDLFNAYHGMVWHNQRFYYNPIIGKLEPIGFDGFGYKPSKRYHFLAEGALHPDQIENASLPVSLMQDTAFIREYIKVLIAKSEAGNWQDFIDRNEQKWTDRLSWLQTEFPSYQPSLSKFTTEVDFVRSHLMPFAINAISGYRQDGKLLVTNTHTLPITILGYGNTDRRMNARFDTVEWLPAGPLHQLRTKVKSEGKISQFNEISYTHHQALAFQTTPYYTALAVPASAQYLYYQLPGLDSVLVAPVQLTIPPSARVVSSQQYKTASQASDFPSLRWNDEQKQVLIPAGQHQISQDLIISPAYELLIAAGADIDLTKRAAIISYGSVKALGEEDLPIKFGSSDGTGQGLQVLQAPQASILYRVVFDGLRNLQKGSWQLTGAVTFLESAVKFSSCAFVNNQSEDALNLVRSEFEMDNCLFQNTASDGFDSDFCKGSLTACHFRNTFNDGLDVSGSVITVKDSQFEGCGDKGISAGEASDVTGINTQITGCVIGVASKDKSTVYLRQLQLKDCEQGLVAFQKKPEFGPAYMLVNDLKAESVTRLYQIAPGSRLQIDDQVIEE